MEEEPEPQIEQFGFDTFEIDKCDRHRNQIEVFCHGNDYILVTKSFNHSSQDARLEMCILRYSPSADDVRGSIYKMFEINWPIVNRSACLDPSMISVLKFQNCLYYFNLVNIEDGEIDTLFQLFKFNLDTEEQELVKNYPFSWG